MEPVPERKRGEGRGGGRGIVLAALAALSIAVGGGIAVWRILRVVSFDGPRPTPEAGALAPQDLHAPAAAAPSASSAPPVPSAPFAPSDSSAQPGARP